MWFSTYNLAKSTCDITRQSNLEKSYLPRDSLEIPALPLMFSYFKGISQCLRRPDALWAWMPWLVWRLPYSFWISVSTKGRIWETRTLLSAIPKTNHRFWFSVTLFSVDLWIQYINKRYVPIFLQCQIQVVYMWTLNLHHWFGLQVQNLTVKQTSDPLCLKCEITTDYGPLVFEVWNDELIKNQTYQWRKWGERGGGSTPKHMLLACTTL